MSDREVDVLLLMRAPGNIRVISQLLERRGIRAVGVSAEDDLVLLLEEGLTPDVALVDVSGFGASVWRMCAMLQERKLPFVVLFQPGEVELSSRTVQYGARSVLQKPVAKSALLQLILGLIP